MTNQQIIETVAEVTLGAINVRENLGDQSVMLNAKNIASSAGMSNASPALRDRLVVMASVLTAALMVVDEAIAAEYGPEEDVATNG